MIESTRTYYTTPGEFSGAETTLLEVWAQMREPGPGEYTISASSSHHLAVCVKADGKITRTGDR